MSYLTTAAALQKPNKPLMVIAGRTLTYGEQWSRCRGLQTWFREQLLVEGSPVLVAVSDEFEHASLLLALILIGHPPLILDPESTADEARIVLENSTFNSIISEAETSNHWNIQSYKLPALKVKAKAKSGGVLGRLLNKRNMPGDTETWPAIAAMDTSAMEIDVLPESLAYVVFTSGTTSRPKGVEIERQALIAQMTTLSEQYRLDENCRLLNTLPLHHVDGLLQGPLLAWSTGCTLYRPMLFTTQHLQAYMDSIYRERITHLIAVPTILALMSRLGKEWRDNFSSEDFRFIVSSAGHLDHHLWAKLEQDFKTTVVNMYGLSETGTSALFSGPDNESHLIGSIGKPVNSLTRIIDGELLISSDQLMRGYHNDPEATNEILRNGWLYTGDLVEELDSGHIKIIGRKKNQINSGGRNISPQEISSCINGHPRVAENIVFGQTDKEWEEQVIALVVLTEKSSDEADLTNWCRKHLSEYKVPKHILFVDSLERGPSGKIRIEAARQLFNEKLACLEDASRQSGNLEERVLSIAAHVFRLHVDDLSLESGIANTPGWDSLAHMSLVVEIEKAFSMRLSPREIMRVESLSQFADICRSQLRS